MRLAFEDVSYSYEGGEAKKKRGRRKKDAARQADWGNAPDAVWALRDVTFTVEPGEFFGVAGHTGSGKSTLIQHMNGLVHPTCGRVLADGRDLAEKGVATEVRRQVGTRVPVSREPAVRQHRLRRRSLRAAQHGAWRRGGRPPRAGGPGLGGAVFRRACRAQPLRSVRRAAAPRGLRRRARHGAGGARARRAGGRPGSALPRGVPGAHPRAARRRPHHRHGVPFHGGLGGLKRPHPRAVRGTRCSAWARRPRCSPMRRR